jgi:hypothetical protein
MFVLGDLNWRKGYVDCLPPGWKLSAQNTATTIRNTSPTVCTGTLEASITASTKLDGVLHHKAVTYVLPLAKPQPVQKTRLTNCAIYSWNDPTIVIKADHSLKLLTDTRCPKCPNNDPIAEKWKNWHGRAEQCWRNAVEADLATLVRKAERAKGSFPISRNVPLGKKHVVNESIVVRRLRRIARRLTHRSHGLDASEILITDDVRKPWNRLAKENSWSLMMKGTTVENMYVEIDKKLGEAARVDAGANARTWRSRFEIFDNDTWKAAKQVVKPDNFDLQLSVSEFAEVCS